MTSAERAVRNATVMLRPIGLDQLMVRAELQTRTDRKYFVPAETFRWFAANLVEDYDVLDIDRRRLFGYESVYFDSPHLTTYRAHLQRRRNRYKVRTRTYLDTGDCMLEVKLEGHRGTTVKRRLSYPADHRRHLSQQARGYVEDLLRTTYDIEPPGQLEPVLTTTYRRATLVARAETARLTCDVALSCRDGAREATALGEHVLVESKSEGPASTADRLLRELGVRPATVSKYCIGVAVLHPGLPCNPWHRTLRRYFDWHPDGAGRLPGHSRPSG